jgi:hypothetical protein
MTSTRRLLTGCVVVTGFLVPAACGGASGSPGVAALGNKSVETTMAQAPVGSPSVLDSKVQGQMMQFAGCMRKNGLPDLPDPVNGFLAIKADSGIDPNSLQFQAAHKACQHLMPQLSVGQQQQSQTHTLKGSQCMRAHGVPNFPGPKFSAGGFSLSLPPGLDPNSPQFQAAERACLSFLPGVARHAR